MDEIIEYFNNLELNFHMNYTNELSITNSFGFVQKTVDVDTGSIRSSVIID